MVFAAVWITVSGSAQKTADIGIWGGTSTYFGDLTNVAVFQTFNPNIGGFFRFNINPRVGIRTMILSGKFNETGVIEGESWEFNKNIQDLSLQLEVNYLKYILGNKKTPFTSYVTFGIGLAYLPYDLDPELIEVFNPDHNKGSDKRSTSETATTIPFGIGFKYSLGSRLGVGIEYQMRKMFSDKLDDLDDPLAHYGPDGKVLYTSEIHNFDWPAYLGIHVTYSFYLGKRVCPVYEKR